MKYAVTFLAKKFRGRSRTVAIPGIINFGFTLPRLNYVVEVNGAPMIGARADIKVDGGRFTTYRKPCDDTTVLTRDVCVLCLSLADSCSVFFQYLLGNGPIWWVLHDATVTIVMPIGRLALAALPRMSANGPWSWIDVH